MKKSFDEFKLKFNNELTTFESKYKDILEINKNIFDILIRLKIEFIKIKEERESLINENYVLKLKIDDLIKNEENMFS